MRERVHTAIPSTSQTKAFALSTTEEFLPPGAFCIDSGFWDSINGGFWDSQNLAQALARVAAAIIEVNRVKTTVQLNPG